MTSICTNDGAFGPGVQGCRGDFDFTQKFEHIFFSIMPASVFVAAALARVAVLSQGLRLVGGRTLQWLKLATMSVYSLLQLAVLVLLITGPPGVVHSLSTAGAALVLAASLFALPLSYAEHSRARKPSTLLGIYLLVTLLLDAAQARTAWLSITTATTTTHQTALARLLTSSAALKATTLCLEAVPKTRWIVEWNSNEHSPEESSGVFALGVYSWLNGLFLRGYRDVLAVDDLYPLDASMASHKLHARLASKMRVGRYREEASFGLCKDVARTLAGPFLSPVAPRIALVGFKFCQPFFITAMLGHLEEDSPTKSHGYGLIGACFLIYVGVALSSALYSYYNQRAVYMMRACLASAIYKKTTQAKLTAADDSAAVTLMSTDLERIVRGSQFVHETWANMLEVAIGSWLLEMQLGTAFVCPLVVIFFCAALLARVLSLVGAKQAAWMARIQNRVGLTSNAVSHMKLYKISGITGPVADLIQKLRVGEIGVGNKYRRLTIVAAVLGFSPVCLSPVVTFAVVSKHLDVNTLFTSLSYIVLLSQPLVTMFQTLPSIFASLTCMQRIQRFLADEPRTDFRRWPPLLVPPAPSVISPSSPDQVQHAFVIKDGSFGWGGDKMTLNHIHASIPSHKLTLMVGPVASGKSTLCKVLLGEMPVSSGAVTTFFPPSQIGYCEQTPFLYNASLRENIIGHCPFNQQLYDQVVDATLLGPDVALLPAGHDTRIGSNGIMLSGGQKQRVSVARALYSQAKVLVFDDVLSGLDNDTEAELFRRVFGPRGMTRRRKATVVVCTHSVRHLPSADHVVALDSDGTVVEQGGFDELMLNNKYVHGLGVKGGADDTPRSTTTSTTTTTQKSTSLQPAPKPKPSPPDFKSALDDKARQTGDLTIYAHYFHSVHPSAPLLLLLSALSYAAANNLSTVWLKFWSEDAFRRSSGFYVAIFGLLRVLQVASMGLNAVVTFLFLISASGTALHRRAVDTVVSAPLRFFASTDSGVVTNLFSQDTTILDSELPMSLTNVSLDVADCAGMAAVIAAASPYLAIGYPFIFALLFFVQRFYLRTSRQLRLLDLESKSPLYTHFLDTIKGVATIRAFRWEPLDMQRNNALLDTSQRPAYLLAMIQQWLTTTLQLLVTGMAVFLTSLATQLRVGAGLTGASLVTLLTFSESISNLIRAYTMLETSLGAVSRLRTFSETVKPEDRPGEDVEPDEDWPRGGRIEMKDVSASYESGPDDEQTPSSSSSSSSSSNLVLRNLNLTILPGEKVAICGRTGSGKSSLLLLLLRLLDPLPCCAQNTFIDGLPLHRIDRATLRRRLVAIPQDAVFLPDGSTVQANIDPLSCATPQECLDVLSAVRLSAFVLDRGGLRAGMAADDLSAGQKQLFSLGRAMLRRRVRDRLLAQSTESNGSSEEEKRGGVLLLDEVSSSVDKATDRAMQEIIRTEFAGYTVVMVSHRLEMVLDFFDRVVVLDQGRLVESGSPRELVETPGSRFGELWSVEHQ